MQLMKREENKKYSVKEKPDYRLTSQQNDRLWLQDWITP
jgi:hypothetical protein